MNIIQMHQKILTNKDEVNARNCRNFHTFVVGGMAISGAVFLAGVFLNQISSFVFEYFLFFCYFLALFGILKFFIKKQSKHILFLFYASTFPIYMGGILLGTFLDSDEPAIVIMVFLCVISLFIIDYPVRLFSYLICMGIIFVVCSFLAKNVEVFYSDVLNLAVFLCISIGVNYLTLIDRVESASNFTLVREKSEVDALTGLFNRGTGERKMRQYMEQKVKGSFVIIDIDNFKHFNDNYGHQVGDEVICKVATELKGAFRPMDVVWRMGGDEFAVYAVELTDMTICKERYQKLESALKQIETSYNEALDVSIGFGCTICQEPAMGFEQLYKLSDSALYEAKNNGKGRPVIYEI